MLANAIPQQNIKAWAATELSVLAHTEKKKKIGVPQGHLEEELGSAQCRESQLQVTDVQLLRQNFKLWRAEANTLMFSVFFVQTC
jgi:hypothetical protein